MELKKIFRKQKNASAGDKHDSLTHIKKVAINTILVGIILTIIIESYYVFIIIDMSLFDIITSVSLVSVVFLLGIAYVLEELEKTEKNLREAEYLQSLMKKQLEGKIRQRTNEVKTLLKQKDEFINQLGHDLKTPLTPLYNLIPILLKEVKNPEHKKILNILNRNVDYIKNLVNRTIELAKLNSLDTTFHLEETNLFNEVKKSIELNKILFDQSNFEINNNISKDIYVKTDKLRLKELFTNLFSNSLKYSFFGKKGEIILDAKKKVNEIIISVKDNGLGLSNNQINHIFDEFYKADESRHDIDSSGLGMSICKRIIERHGGRIWIESPGIDKGSTVYFTLPSINTENNNPTIEEIHLEIDNVLLSTPLKKNMVFLLIYFVLNNSSIFSSNKLRLKGFSI
jgi:signal transduction histidine kinase